MVTNDHMVQAWRVNMWRDCRGRGDLSEHVDGRPGVNLIVGEVDIGELARSWHSLRHSQCHGSRVVVHLCSAQRSKEEESTVWAVLLAPSFDYSTSLLEKVPKIPRSLAATRRKGASMRKNWRNERRTQFVVHSLILPSTMSSANTRVLVPWPITGRQGLRGGAQGRLGQPCSWRERGG